MKVRNDMTPIENQSEAATKKKDNDNSGSV
jgi:hypothetical protein